MKPKFVRSATALIAAAVLCTATRAADYLCESTSGCTATKFTNGTPTKVKFRHGDMVSTEAGWVVHEEDGWREL